MNGRLARAAAVAAAIVLAIVLGGAAWFYVTTQRDARLPAQPVVVIVPRGATLSQIARSLARYRVIGNAAAFRLLAKLRGAQSDLRAGEYRFAAHRTQSAVLEQLLTGGAQVAVWVTFPEGFTAKQIAYRLAGSGVGRAPAFERAFLRDSIVVDGTRTHGLEGFLFPSTYLIPMDATPQQVESILTGEFFAQLPPGAAARARALGLTVPQVIAIASLIEREAKIDSDRPLMASVYYNRLRLHMPLQVDATIEYALPKHAAELSFADLRIDSPYNTYLHEGLPPTPIANPGAPSLHAAFYPAHTQYLYYVYEGNGYHAFAKTLAEHDANVAKYLK